MRAFDYEAVVFDGAVYCRGCLPKAPEGYEHQQVKLSDDEVSPIFADSEWDAYPVCDACGELHEYVGLTEHGRAVLAMSREPEHEPGAGLGGPCAGCGVMLPVVWGETFCASCVAAGRC